MTKKEPKKHFWIYVIAAVASLGGLLSGFDMGVISGALLFINETWTMTPLEQGWLVSSAIAGSVVGAAANGFLADMYGRKKIIIATAVIFVVGSLMCGFAQTISQLIIARIIIGIARIFYLRIITAAKRTFHTFISLFVSKPQSLDIILKNTLLPL